jgi:succinyl-CoA synthetase beta subunit
MLRARLLAPAHPAHPAAQVVVKSQILAGGRGLGKFTSGLQGGVHVCSAADAPALAAKMLGGTLVTKQVCGWRRACPGAAPPAHPGAALFLSPRGRVELRFTPTAAPSPAPAQTGPKGKPVNTLYVANKMKLDHEMYFAILLDRASAGPVIIACAEGGTSIEDLAERFPDKIVKVPVDIKAGITNDEAAQASCGRRGRGGGPLAHVEARRESTRRPLRLRRPPTCP